MPDFPNLYPILDASFLAGADHRSALLGQLVRDLVSSGVRILQYRNKTDDEAQILADARVLRDSASGTGLRLILNDHPGLAVRAGFDGAHIGQTDMLPAEARRILGPGKVLGFSTHNEAQLRAAASEPVDYLAIGPIYPTASKENPDPVIGLDGVRLARRLAGKPVVAIGGITAANAAAVLHAGADSVAVISAIFCPGQSPGQLARDFLHSLSPQAQS